MGAGAVVILVGAILAGNAMVLFGVLFWVRGRLRRCDAALRDSMLGGEQFLAGPVPGTYRGASDRFGKVKGAAVVALTDRRLLCAKAFGDPIRISLDEVEGVREDKWFLRAYNTLPHVIVKLHDGTEVGFQVREHARFMELLRSRLGPSA